MVTLSLSDRCIFLPVPPEGSEGLVPTNHNKKEDLEVLGGSPPMGILLLEPGGPAHRTTRCCTVDQR